MWRSLRVLIQYVLNCATALIGALALAHFEPGTHRFDRVLPAWRLVFFGGLVAPFTTSVLMAAVFLTTDIDRKLLADHSSKGAHQHVRHPHRGPSDGAHRRPAAPNGASSSKSPGWSKARLLAVCLAAASLAALFAPPIEAVAAAAMLCLPLPMLLWAAARFGVVGSSAAMLLFGVFAVCGALTGAGPFTAQADAHDALSVVLFLVVTCIPLLLLGAALDERRSLESARAASDALHGAVLASIQDQIVILDSSGRIVDANESWRLLAERIPAAPFVNLKVGENLLRHCSRLGAQGRRPRHAPRPLRQRSDCRPGAASSPRIRCARAAAASSGSKSPSNPCVVPSGGAVLVWTDVTYRKQAEAKERAQQQQLVHLGRAAVLGELSGAFAHELTPATDLDPRQCGSGAAAAHQARRRSARDPHHGARHRRRRRTCRRGDPAAAGDAHARRDLARARRPGQRHQGRARPRAHRPARRGTCPSTWYSIPTCRWYSAIESSCSRWCSTWS